MNSFFSKVEFNRMNHRFDNDFKVPPIGRIGAAIRACPELSCERRR
jgi:hypothetical protein